MLVERKQEAQLMLTNPRNAFRGKGSSLDIAPLTAALYNLGSGS